MARAAQRQPLLGGHVAVDLTAHAHVRALDRGLDGGAFADGHISAGLELALDVARDFEIALDLQASVQAVARAEVDDVRAAVGGRRRGVSRRFFCLGHLGILH